MFSYSIVINIICVIVVLFVSSFLNAWKDVSFFFINVFFTTLIDNHMFVSCYKWACKRIIWSFITFKNIREKLVIKFFFCWSVLEILWILSIDFYNTTHLFATNGSFNFNMKYIGKPEWGSQSLRNVNFVYICNILDGVETELFSIYFFNYLKQTIM